jgi:hypothetical protein
MDTSVTTLVPSGAFSQSSKSARWVLPFSSRKTFSGFWMSGGRNRGERKESN